MQGRAKAGGTTGEATAPSRRRRAVFALLSVLLALLALAATELVLRLAGVGDDLRFLVPIADQAGSWMSNPRYGWRYFPPSIARTPLPLRVDDAPANDAIRLVVLGGSAALGTPEAAFGFGRFLLARLEQQFPERKVEVINAAMAAINSHVVRDLARSVVRHRPDALLVYLGNNEIVGPYGPGTVFAPFAGQRSVIMAGVWLRGTRLGQLLGRLLQLGGGVAPSEWRGMEMFVDRLVPAADPRLERAYRHLAGNLRDVVAAGRRVGAPVLLSTVAVNLLDSPPFASVHTIAEPQRERYRELLHRGTTALGLGELERAGARLGDAVRLDPGHAEGRYQLGRALAAAGDRQAALRELGAARDLDALRFRADQRINSVIRQVATTTPGAVLVDAERRLAEDAASPGLPGDDLFWEHVHLRPEGNARLAAEFERVLLPLLVEDGAPAVAEPAPPAEITARLALTAASRAAMCAEILRLTTRSPFDRQSDHDERLSRRRRELALLRARAADVGDQHALLEAAATAHPEDLFLAVARARLLERGAPLAAAAAWSALLDRVPGVPAWATSRAFALAAGGRIGEASALLRGLAEEQPQAAEAQLNRAALALELGELDDAEEALARALALAPADPVAALDLAWLRELQHRPDEALDLYAAAAAQRTIAADALARQAALLARLGRASEAEATFRRALEVEPGHSPAGNNLGVLLEQQGRLGEAAAVYRRVLTADPANALALFNLGDALLAGGDAGAAVEAYELALRLEPGNAQGRANLETARRLVTAGTR